MFVTPDNLIPNFIDLKNGRVFDPQMLNRYAYCRNNPLIYVDPSGHDVEGGGGSHWGTTGQANYDKNPFVQIAGWVKERYHRSKAYCEEKEYLESKAYRAYLVDYMMNQKGYKVAVITPGLHSALFVDNNGQHTLYDPGGSYNDGLGGRGSSDTFVGMEANLSDYVDYWSQDGEEVGIQAFDLSPDEVKEILERIDEQGGMLPGFCTQGVSSAIKGIGPFKNLDFKSWPSSLEKALRKIENQ